MAPSDEKKDHERAQHDTANPFVSFRRFADEQMSNLLRGVFGLSSTFGPSSSSPDRSLNDYQAWLQEARHSQQTHESEAEEAGHIMDVYARAHQDSAQEEILRAVQEAEEPSKCPYRPADQEGPQRESDSLDLSLTALGVHLPPTILAAPVLGAQLSSVPIAYLLYSPYSPVRLEQQPALRDHVVHWREAFEDLLSVQNGEQVSSECDHDSPVPSIDWVRRMIGRAMCKRDQDKDEEDRDADSQAVSSIPGRMVRFTATRQPENDANERDGSQAHQDRDQCESGEEQVTDLDLYKYFLGIQGISLSTGSSSSEPSSSVSQLQSQSQSSAHLQHYPNLTETDGKKPSILSTLTTTERTAFPDGTTHTKVVLKKRFSDGREESTETMSTQNPLPNPQYQPPTRAIGDHGASETTFGGKGQEKKKTGWFWS